MRRTALVACALFLLSCLLGFGGLLSHAFPGDTETYSRYGRALVNHGRIPYHDSLPLLENSWHADRIKTLRAAAALFHKEPDNFLTLEVCV